MPSKGFARKKGNKAQSSLEYLITYGWALVAVATIIGVLVFTAGGGVNINTCTNFLTIVCKGVIADGDTLVMVLQNATGQTIAINPFEDICFDGICGYGQIEYGGTTYRFDTVEIGAGEQFRVLGAGQVLANQMSLTYTEGQTGLKKTVTSGLGTDAPFNTELSNDGQDNDGDSLVDCQQAGLGPCEYVVENGTPVPTTINDGATSTITFTSPSMEAGTWGITGGTIGVYVTSGAGATMQARLSGWTYGSPETVRNGWNYIDTGTIAAELINEFNIEISVTGGNVVISNAGNEAPKAVITLDIG